MTTTKTPSDWLLERYRVGEVSADERAQVEAALQQDERVKARLDALDADDARVLERHPPARVAASVRAAATQPAPKRTRRWVLAPVLAAAAAVVLVAVPLASRDDDIRLKGGDAQLSVYRLTQQGPVRLDDGALVRGGDVVQARYHLTERAAVVLLSFDAMGQVTVHDRASAQPAGAHAMASSFELDASPGFERFVLVVGTTIDLEAVVTQAKRVASGPSPTSALLALPAENTQRSVVLSKAEVR